MMNLRHCCLEPGTSVARYIRAMAAVRLHTDPAESHLSINVTKHCSDTKHHICN